MDAKPYDDSRDKRRRIVIAVIALVIVLIGLLWWHFRFWPEERAANKFFIALEQKNYEGAYALWMADPNWKQHPQNYSRYPFSAFYQDWGPPGDYGAITSHKIEDASNPDTGAGSGVIVSVQVNNRPVVAKIWIEKGNKSMSFPP